MRTHLSARLAKHRRAWLACIGSLSVALPGLAGAQQTVTVVVDATADLFNAAAVVYEGIRPTALNVTGLTSLTFAVSAGNTVSYNIGTGSNYNNADGIGSVSNVFSTGGGGISGLTAPNAGFLAGVFLSATPAASAPAALNFTSGGTSFSSLSPLLQQSFFIGDGRTGNATGATQTFFVPTGATTLYLGFVDACGYSGPPSCYLDNAGSFTVTTQAAAVPDLPSLASLSLGLGLLASMRRKSRRMAPAMRRSSRG